MFYPMGNVFSDILCLYKGESSGALSSAEFQIWGRERGNAVLK